MPSNLRFAAALSLMACLFAGCRSASVSDPVAFQAADMNEPEKQLDFWHAIATRPMISNDEAFHGLLLYVNGKDHAGSYEDRVTTLKSMRLLPASFNQPASQALQRGTLAVPLAKTLKLKGGLTMRLAANSPRYATRELEYRGIYPTSGAQQIFTGGEFVGVIGKAQDYRQGDPTNFPAAEMPAAVAYNDAERITPILAMIAPAPGELTLNPTTAATTQATQPSGPLKVVITEVQGLASVRPDENSEWGPARKGMELTEQAEFRTGPVGTIQFVIPPNQVFSIDRLTTAKVLVAIRSGGKVKTDVGIKYGRQRYDLEGGGLEHESTLRSPNATLAVRGTKVSLFDQPPFAPQATSLTGRAEFKAFRKQALAFGNRGQGKTIVSSESDTAGAIALSQTVVDPNLAGARTESEAALVTTLVSRGATVSIDRETGIKIIRGGGAPTDAQVAASLPGPLSFVVRWNTDLNLDVGISTPGTEFDVGGEFVYPAAGLNLSPSGGKTAFDHRGGTGGGVEVIYFDKFVDGAYNIGARVITPGATGTATIDAFLNGTPLPILVETEGGLVIQPHVQTAISPKQPVVATVFVGEGAPPILPKRKPVPVSASVRKAQLMGPMPVNPKQAKPR